VRRRLRGQRISYAIPGPARERRAAERGAERTSDRSADRVG
jgi:hypothetical protein